jgi:hypothetical protein
MTTKLGCSNHYEVRLIVSAEFWEMAQQVAEREPLIGGPEGYIQALLNTALLGEEERLADQETPTEQPILRDDMTDDVPF